MESIFMLAAFVLGMVALVQSFRVYDARELLDSYKTQVSRAETRSEELWQELRRSEKQQARTVQMVTDLADKLNE